MSASPDELRAIERAHQQAMLRTVHAAEQLVDALRTAAAIVDAGGNRADVLQDLNEFHELLTTAVDRYRLARKAHQEAVK